MQQASGRLGGRGSPPSSGSRCRHAPFRAPSELATAALVLVVPVVVGVAIGGFVAGVVSVAAGFLVYDSCFIPPYGAPEGRSGAGLGGPGRLRGRHGAGRPAGGRASTRARAEAQRRAVDARRLFDLSELLVEDRSVEDLLKTIVEAVRNRVRRLGRGPARCRR